MYIGAWFQGLAGVGAPCRPGAAPAPVCIRPPGPGALSVLRAAGALPRAPPAVLASPRPGSVRAPAPGGPPRLGAPPSGVCPIREVPYRLGVARGRAHPACVVVAPRRPCQLLRRVPASVPAAPAAGLCLTRRGALPPCCIFCTHFADVSKMLHFHFVNFSAKTLANLIFYRTFAAPFRHMFGTLPALLKPNG